MKKFYSKFVSLGAVYSIGNVAHNILSIVLIPLYTTYLVPEDYGILALMNITISLLSQSISTVIGTAFSRFYYSPDYRDKSGVLLFNLFSLLIVKTLALAVIYFFMSKYILELLFDNQEYLYIVQIYTIILLLNPVSTFLLSFLRLLERAKYYVFISLTNLVFSSGLIIYLLIGMKLGVMAVIYGNIFGLFYTCILSFPILIMYSEFKLSLSIIKEPLNYSYPQLVSGYSQALFQSGDRYVLRIFESLSNVGLYSFGYRIGSILNMVLGEPIKNTLMPIILQNEDNPQEQKRFLASAADYYYLVGIFMALGLSLFAREVIMFLARNSAFWPSWIIVPIITLAYVQHGLGYFFDWGIVIRKKSYHISGITLFSVLVNIGFNFLFIPLWGIIGAAFATLLSYVVWNFLKAYYSAKFYNLHFNLKRLSHITSIGVSLYFLSLLIASGDSLWINIGIKILIFIAYFPLFYLSGFFSENEKVYIKLSLKKISDDGIIAFLQNLAMEKRRIK